MSNRIHDVNKPALLMVFLVALALFMTVTPVVSQETQGQPVGRI